ncbi:MAG: ATP-binding protein [Phenylobacterium sp.]|nr:ATP-binding protein [Phenylobacterium sp.]
MESPRVIGHIVAVQGFRVKVELLPGTHSAMRATLDGVQVAVAINAYLTFSLGAGQTVIGVITDLEARESYDPSSGDELTLELIKPRRVASVQLLGTISRAGEKWTFSAGITILPTLDTPAEISPPDVLKAVFETPPRRNRPDDYEGDDDDFDCDLTLGCPTGQPQNVVRASYNDMFSRPLAIVGNTGSGKSFSVSSLIQKAMAALGDEGNEPHIFVLDINGEYGKAFGGAQTLERRPDHVYLNGQEFPLPIWLFNAAEVCAWLSASEQTQEPVLKDWWALAKAKSTNKALAADANSLRLALQKANAIVEVLNTTGRPKKKPAVTDHRIMEGYLGGRELAGRQRLTAALAQHQGQLNANPPDFNSPLNEAEIRSAAEELAASIKEVLAGELAVATVSATTADSPLYIPRSKFQDPSLIDAATSPEEAGRIEAHLTTLKLRLQTRLDDPRWRAFLNYEEEATKVTSLEDWLKRFGLGVRKGPRVAVLDLSMLSHEVLPYACTVIGRVLLEIRENLPAKARYKHPWVLVLEEAHNYARPPRSDEAKGQTLSRLAFERIAKEGRKFGLSLIIASQRPSEISQTIISQCANFVSHRLQNPDDIEHFRRIIPMQARRLLDQVTILDSGEAIVFGSAFHIPTRVQFTRPEPGPWSTTAAPYHEWRMEKAAFPLDTVVDAWGIRVQAPPHQMDTTAAANVGVVPGETDEPPRSKLDDEIPF